MELKFEVIIECAPDDGVNPHSLCEEIQEYLDSGYESTAQVVKYHMEQDQYTPFYPNSPRLYDNGRA
jgi:hypothetical protein|tara:strand:+ start:33 stop:233 length:201 start_codon:yes stop_codon:yes gene_type:complete